MDSKLNRSGLRSSRLNPVQTGDKQLKCYHTE
jgi:hypothetical protein